MYVTDTFCLTTITYVYTNVFILYMYNYTIPGKIERQV